MIQGEKSYQLIRLGLESGESIETTAEHPFYIKGKGWQPASSLKVGEALQLHNGVVVVIKTIDTSVRFEKVYNLTVANTHNYFVGDDGMLVHNCLTKAQQAAVKKINEIEHMLRTHNNLSGDLLDDGHINKLKDSRVGIGKSIRSIMNSLRNPNLNSEARAILEQQLRIAQRIWDRIDEILSSL